MYHLDSLSCVVVVGHIRLRSSRRFENTLLEKGLGREGWRTRNGSREPNPREGSSKVLENMSGDSVVGLGCNVRLTDKDREKGGDRSL